MAGTLADAGVKTPAPDNKTTPTPVAAEPAAAESMRTLADLRPPSVLQQDYDPNETLRYFKHRAVPRFVIKMGKLKSGRSGDFVFERGVCAVPASRIDDFLNACANLTPIDFNNIVEILNIQNERPLESVVGGGSTAVRGTVTTDRVKEPQKNA